MRKLSIALFSIAFFSTLCIFGVLSAHASYIPGAFVTTWKTDNPGTSASNQITIPTTGDGYNYDIDWGDSTTDTAVTGDITHTYASPGTYTVQITGDFPRIFIDFYGDRQKLLSVEQWGTIHWASMVSAFFGASNMVINAADAPDLSAVTDMNNMFDAATAFNQDISSWNVSNVTNMNGMFAGTTSFNQPLNSWNVSNVTNMGEMFSGATSFNQPLNSWNVSNVTNLGHMFEDATHFNGDISSWNVSNDTDMTNMFINATAFNQDISSWNVSNVTNLGHMFQDATAFNQDISSWNVSNVTDMTGIFNDDTLSTTNYDALLEGWSTLPLQSNVTFSGGNSLYYCATAQRASIISTYSWSITDGGLDSTPAPCTPKLFYHGNFSEVSSGGGALTGSRTVTLFGDTFINANSTLTLNTNYTLSPIPAGLTPVMSVSSDGTVATLTFTGNATSNDPADDVSDLTITFLDGAFTNTATASDVANYSDTSGTITFNSQSISYDGNFSEVSSGGGAIDGSRNATLSGDTFINANSTLTLNTNYTLSPIPAGLTPVMTVSSDGTVATLTFTGSATDNGSADSISNLTITFLDGAFTNTALASDVTNYSDASGSISFNDQSISYDGNFTERGSNDGSIDGSRTVTLFGDTFINANSTLTLNTNYTLSPIPAGLTPVMSVSSDGTVATLTFTGNATSNDPADDVSDLTITFLDGAFTNTATASDVANYSDTSGTITFNNYSYFTGTDQTLYGIDGDDSDGNPNPPNLYILDPTTGLKLQTIGPVGFDVTGMAFHPTTGILYGVTGENDATGNNPKSLITIDPTTGAGTLLGALEDSSNASVGFGDISFRSDGRLYGVDNSGGNLYTIDISSCDGTTCTVTQVGTSGLSSGYGNGLAFDSHDNLFFLGNGDNSYFKLDPDTGISLGETAFSNPSDQNYDIGAATFNQNGFLIASRMDYGSSPSDLIAVDTSTQTIASAGVTADMQYMNAIAFKITPVVSTTPAPTTGGYTSGGGGGGTGASTPPSSPLPPPSVVPPTTPSTPAQATNLPKINIITTLLRQGATSTAVKTLQQLLNDLGFTVSTTGAGSKGHESTSFGPKTKQALQKFQKAHGLTPDGIIGPKTLKVLNQYTKST